jgi:hypothetical protein
VGYVFISYTQHQFCKQNTTEPVALQRGLETIRKLAVEATKAAGNEAFWTNIECKPKGEEDSSRSPSSTLETHPALTSRILVPYVQIPDMNSEVTLRTTPTPVNTLKSPANTAQKLREFAISFGAAAQWLLLSGSHTKRKH